MEDTYKHRGMRRQLVKELVTKGIQSEQVLAAIGKVPRHFFFESVFDHHAYEDKAFPIGEGQTISQPYTVAFQTELLEVKQDDKILEIGTGSGYQTSVLLELGATVYTIEYQKRLFEKTNQFLPKIGYKAHFYEGDGSGGIPEKAPYDGIIVTAGAPAVPKELIVQLKIGGRLVIPVGNNKRQKMMLFEKINPTKVSKKEFPYFSFVPLLGEKGWNNKKNTHRF